MSVAQVFIHRQQVTRFSRPRRRDDEEIVQSGLAVTPSMMLEMAEHNIPIAAQNLGLTYDEGVSKLDFDVPLEYQRGIDISDAWEERERIKGKFREGLKNVKFESQNDNE